MSAESTPAAASQEPATAADAIAVLISEGLTIGVAESLTGGLLAAELISVPGASAAVRGGIVAYATPLKHSLLDVDAGLLALHGAVHPDVALQMADGVRRAVAVDGLAADVGVATTGVAGPDQQDGREVGTVYVGIVSKAGGRVLSLQLDGDRDRIRRDTVAAAIAALVDELG